MRKRAPIILILIILLILLVTVYGIRSKLDGNHSDRSSKISYENSTSTQLKNDKKSKKSKSSEMTASDQQSTISSNGSIKQEQKEQVRPQTVNVIAKSENTLSDSEKQAIVDELTNEIDSLIKDVNNLE